MTHNQSNGQINFIGVKNTVADCPHFSALVSLSKNIAVFPGFCDVHVHFREPGFSYKETVKSGSAAAARGGYTAVCTMPNLNPVPDSFDNLEKQLDIIKKDSLINIYPYAAITVGQWGEELSDMESLSQNAIAFSDDGRGVQSEALMREAMLKAKALGKMIVSPECRDRRCEIHNRQIWHSEVQGRNAA